MPYYSDTRPMVWYDNNVRSGRATRFNVPAELTWEKVRGWDPDDPARANKAAAQLEELASSCVAEWHNNNGDEEHSVALSRLFNNSASRFACLRVALCRSVPSTRSLLRYSRICMRWMRRPAALRHAL